MSELLGKLYEKRDVAAANVAPEPCCDWSREFPVLFTFLTCSHYSGRPRQTGTLMLMCEMGVAKSWVNDRHSGLSAFVSGKTYHDLFIAIEAGLAANSLEWRAAKGHTNGFNSSGRK
jgi:hypothetical protein